MSRRCLSCSMMVIGFDVRSTKKPPRYIASQGRVPVHDQRRGTRKPTRLRSTHLVDFGRLP